VRDLANDGQGIIPTGWAGCFFAPGVWPEEVGQFRIHRVPRPARFARLDTFAGSRPGSSQPPCPHHGFRPRATVAAPLAIHSIHRANWRAKQRRVEAALARFGPGDKLKPIIAAPKEWGYRNRAQFKTDGQQLGYVAPGSRNIATVADCQVLSDPNRATLRAWQHNCPTRPGGRRHYMTGPPWTSTRA